MSTLFERAEAYDTMISRVYELIPYEIDEAETILGNFYRKGSSMVYDEMVRLKKQKLLATLEFLENSNLDTFITNATATATIVNAAITTSAKAIETLKAFDSLFLLNRFGLNDIKKIKSKKLRILLYEKMIHGDYSDYAAYALGKQKEILDYVLSSEPLEVFAHLSTSMCPRISQLIQQTAKNTQDEINIDSRHGYSSRFKGDEFFRLNKLALCRAACANSDHRVLEYLYENFYAPASGFLSLEKSVTKGTGDNLLGKMVCSEMESDEDHETTTPVLCLTTFSPQVFLWLTKTEPLFTVPKITKRLKYHLQNKTLDSSIFLFKLFLLCPSLHQEHQEMQNDQDCTSTSSASASTVTSASLVGSEKSTSFETSASSTSFVGNTGAELRKDIQKIGNYCEQFIASLRQVHPPAAVLILEYFL